MPRSDRKVADRRAPRTRRANTEKPRAKVVRRTAGALKAGRSPGGAPAVMKDQAGAPARKKGSGTQRQSTRWEPEPERKAVCPGQSATGCLPGSGANEGHAQSTTACRRPGKAPRGKAGDNARQRSVSRQSGPQTEKGASFQKTLYPTAECMGRKSTSARIREKPQEQESAAATLASSTATCAGKRFRRQNVRPIARRRHTSAGRATSKGTTRTACMTKSCEKSPRRQEDDARATMGRPSPDSAVHTRKYGPHPGLQGGFRRRSATLQRL